MAEIKPSDVGHPQNPVENPQTSPLDTPPGKPGDTPHIPDKFQGKSAEELVAILNERDRKIGEMSTEVGKSRDYISELENLKAYYETVQPQGKPENIQTDYGTYTPEGQRATPNPPINQDSKYQDEYGNLTPEGARKLMQDEWQKMATDMEKRTTQAWRQISDSKSFLEQAKKEAPHLFSDVNDQEIQGVIFGYLSRGQLNPMNLGITKTWKMAANYVRGEKTDYNYSPSPTVGSPVPASFTETPASVRPSGPAVVEDIHVTDADRQTARELGLPTDDDSIRDYIRKGADTGMDVVRRTAQMRRS